MYATGQLTQLADGFPGLLAGRRDQRAKRRIGGGGPVAGHGECQGKRDKALLGAVVQVALETAPLGVARLDDARPGGADLLKLRLHLGLQAGMVQGQARGRRRQPDQLRLVLQRLVVDQHGLPGSG